MISLVALAQHLFGNGLSADEDWGDHGMSKKTKAGLSGKDAARDVPSWAKGQRPLRTENGRQFAERLLDEKYGKGNFPTGSGSEFSKKKGG